MTRKKTVLALILLLLICLQSRDWAQPKAFAFAVLGDYGCGCSGEKAVADRMISWWQKNPFYTILTLGDNVYPGRGGAGGSRYLFQERFDFYYKPLLDRGVKFYATLGNHDLETNRGGDEIADKSRFHILQDVGYYSFRPPDQADGRPLIEFFALNSNRLLTMGADPPQIAWLSKALTDTKAIWKVVYFHHPIYSPEGPHSAELGLRQGIEKILVASGVQLVMAGHSHYYARMKLQNGILHLISGGGGKDLKTPRPSPETEKTAETFHFLYLEAFPDRIEYWAIGTSGTPFDHGIVLPKMPSAAPSGH